MRILLIVATIVVIGFSGLYLLWRMGMSTKTFLVATYPANKDVLTIHKVFTTDWGNAYYATVFKWNERMIDLRGTLRKLPNEWTKIFPVHPKDQQQLTVDYLVSEQEVVWLRSLERLQNSSVPSYQAQADSILEAHPEAKDIIPFTIWVNPHQFSPQEYECIKKALQAGSSTLMEQQKAFEQSPKHQTYPFDMLSNRKKPLLVWRMVYSDYDVLPVRVFTRKQVGVEEIISIDADGGVGFLHKSKNYVAGYGASLGELNATADTILVYPYWNEFEEYVPLEELASFQNEKGLPLEQFYRLMQLPWETE